MGKRLLFIFGSEGGLGKGVTDVLLKHKYDKIVLYDFKFGESSLTDSRIERRIISDLSISANCSDLFKGIETDEQSLAFLFSSIGGYIGGAGIEETGEGDVAKMLDLNYKVSFNILREFSAFAKRCKGTSVMFTSALKSLMTGEGAAAYGASKAALNYLVESAAAEGRQLNMSVNAIAPFMIDTPLNRTWVSSEELPTLIRPAETGDFINSVFNNFHFISGNIFKFNYRFPKIWENE